MPRQRGTHEDGQTGDGAADHKGVDLKGAPVGVDSLGVRDEPADLVVRWPTDSQQEMPAEKLKAFYDKVATEYRYSGEQNGPSGAARTACRPTATCRQIGGSRVLATARIVTQRDSHS